VARLEEKQNAYRFMVVIADGKRSLENLSVNERIILKKGLKHLE
jgi:hypothetical protein